MSKLQTFRRWFFFLGSFVFLYWYMPLAVQDDKVTAVEITYVVFNLLALLVNGSQILSKIYDNTSKTGVEK